jgi:nicotinate-nucleotide adenylyltransferase
MGRGLGVIAGSRGAASAGRAGAGWAIFGGTFDPVHLGHLAIAEQAIDELALDGVLWVPAGLPPHKTDQVVTDAGHRAAMVELAIAGNPRFRMSRVELERTGPSYSVDTVLELTADGGLLAGTEPVLLISSEALHALPSWHQPDRLISLARIGVIPRLGYPAPTLPWIEEQFPGRSDRFIVLAGPWLGHSSSAIRRRSAAGQSIRYLVPGAVRNYVETNRLYRPELSSKH